MGVFGDVGEPKFVGAFGIELVAGHCMFIPMGAQVIVDGRAHRISGPALFLVVNRSPAHG